MARMNQVLDRRDVQLLVDHCPSTTSTGSAGVTEIARRSSLTPYSLPRRFLEHKVEHYEHQQLPKLLSFSIGRADENRGSLYRKIS